MRLVVDFVGFEDNEGKCIIKELAVVDVHSGRLQHFVFKCGMSWNDLTSNAQYSNTLKIRNEHGINWGEGNIPYNEIVDVMTRVLQRATVVYGIGANVL